MILADRLSLLRSRCSQVKFLQEDQAVLEAQRRNLQHAIDVALLLLPSRFTEEDFFVKLAGISYLGMLRIFDDDNQKIPRNIHETSF